jgi:MFS family permease
MRTKHEQSEEKFSMTSKIMTPGKSRVFYGWIALSGAMLTAFVASGSFVYSYGVFLPVMCAEFGWSRAVLSLGLSLGLLCFGLPSPLFGVLVARFGPRANTILGNLLTALCLAGMSMVQEVWHVYLLYSFTGLGAGIGGYIASTTVANNWFIRKRPLAMGLFLASAGLGGFVFPPLATVLISSIGWRMSWLVLAGIVFVAASLLGGVILIRNKPEDMGLVPDGISAESFEGVVTTEYRSGVGLESEGWQIGQALREPATWIIAVFGAANYFALGTMVAHQVAYVRDLGFGPVVAALTMSLVSGLSIIGRAGFGALALRFNMKNLAAVFFGIQLIALAILLTSHNLVLIYIYAILFGVSNGALLTAVPTFVGAYYGRVHYAQIVGVIFALGIAFEAAAPAIAGVIYDATTTYTLAFSIVAAFSLVGFICLFLARQPKPPLLNG